VEPGPPVVWAGQVTTDPSSARPISGEAEGAEGKWYSLAWRSGCDTNGETAASEKPTTTALVSPKPREAEWRVTLKTAYATINTEDDEGKPAMQYIPV
jgi:hypothetical protein